MQDVQKALRAILARRALIEQFDGVRLVDGVGDGLPGLYLDRFGSLLLAHIIAGEREARSLHDQLRAGAKDLVDAAHGKTLYQVTHSRDPKQSAKQGAEHLFGPRENHWLVKEGKASYLVAPEQNINAGLFLDMREVRLLLQHSSAHHRVLNLFCFTGSLGVAAAVGGAREVVQVDVSARMLKWAKENAASNEVANACFRYITEDAVLFLQREVRRLERGNEPYQSILIDPPTFGSSKGKVFNLKRALPGMVSDALRLLAPGGRLFLTCNQTDISAKFLEAEVRTKAREIGRELGTVSLLAAPAADFTAPTNDAITMRGVIAERR